jgi:hypothetical protein
VLVTLIPGERTHEATHPEVVLLSKDHRGHSHSHGGLMECVQNAKPRMTERTSVVQLSAPQPQTLEAVVPMWR